MLKDSKLKLNPYRGFKLQRFKQIPLVFVLCLSIVLAYLNSYGSAPNSEINQTHNQDFISKQKKDKQLRGTKKSKSEKIAQKSNSKSSDLEMKPEFLNQVFSRYKNSQLVTFLVKKKIKSELMDKEKIYEGKIYLSSKLFRWDTESPEKSQVIFDGSQIWSVQYPPQELGGKPSVSQMKLDSRTKKQILFSMLFNQKSVTKSFEIIKVNKLNDGLYEFKIKPKTPDLSIQSLSLHIKSPEKEINQISFDDDLGNLTIIDVEKTLFAKKNDPSLFKFQVPAGVTVNKL